MIECCKIFSDGDFWICELDVLKIFLPPDLCVLDVLIIFLPPDLCALDVLIIFLPLISVYWMY